MRRPERRIDDHAEILGPEPRDQVADEQNRHTHIEAGRRKRVVGLALMSSDASFMKAAVQYRATAPNGRSLSNRAHRG
jgi:hypothetical protein